MCVACHPHEVAVIAGGTFAGIIHQHHMNVMLEYCENLLCFIGEVKVWYLATDSKWLVISSALEVGAHKEPVTKVSQMCLFLTLS